jgi:Flp pilus assembly protein TadD
LLVMGKFSGTEKSLKVAIRILDLKTLKLSGEITANGPLSAMPQMENELAWLILANSNLEKGATREEFQKRIRKVPNSAYAYFIQCLGSANRNSQIQFLKRAVELYRDFPKAQTLLGQLYFYRRDCENALKHLVLGREEGNSNSEKEFMQGTCRLVKGQTDQALALLSHVLTTDRSYEALNNLGIAYLQNGDLASSVTYLAEAKSLAHTDAAVSANNAVVHLIQGNNSLARNEVEEAVRLHPKNGMLQFLYSYVLKKLGDEEKALSAAARAKSLGINIDTMQNEDPRSWAKAIFGREH